MARHNFRGEFKVQDRISTTLSPELQRLAFDKAIRWSEALEFGIKKLAYGGTMPDQHDYGVVIHKETEKNQVEQYKRALRSMQELINKQNEKYDILEKEKG